MQFYSVLLLICVSYVFGQLNFDSQQDVQFPSTLTSSQPASSLVTSNFGVVSMSTAGKSMTIASFDVDEFIFYNKSIDIPSCISNTQLIPANDVSFLVFCPVTNSLDAYYIGLVNVSEDGSLMITRHATFSDLNNTLVISQSAFVTAGGYIYMTTLLSGPDSDYKISIYQFSVADFTLKRVVNNVVELLSVEWALNLTDSIWEVADVHSMPSDEGVLLIVNQQGNDAPHQIFAAIYANSTVVSLQVPGNESYFFVGRHRGSNFGYVVSFSLIYSDVYSYVTSYNFQTLTMHNTISIKGRVAPHSRHFSTESSVYIFLFSPMQRDNGYIYELPYTNLGFSEGSESSVLVDAYSTANLGEGVDGEHVYCITAGAAQNSMYLSRWTY